MTSPFRIGVSREFLTPDGRIGWGDIGLNALEERDDIEWEFLPERHAEITSKDLAGFDAVLALGERYPAAAFDQAGRLKIIARFGVGYDNIDVEAATRAGVLVSITPDGVRRPVALSALTLILAMAHRFPQKTSLVAAGRWDDRLDYMTRRITGATLATIGLGNIGSEVFRLTSPLQMRHLAYDPYVDPAVAEGLGVELTDVDTVLRQADYLVLTVALTPETRHLIRANELKAMKRSAFLINVARGPIVDETALIDALSSGQIAGAALDVFENEPLPADSPLRTFDNVLLTPHALCWGDELALGNGRSAIDAILAVADGRTPDQVINRVGS